MSENLCKVPSLELIKARLPQIFPEGLDQREYLIREMAAKVIFVMFYVGAIESTGRRIRPNQVTLMTDAQAIKTDSIVREEWAQYSITPRKKGQKDVPDRWYAVDSREGVRDETIKDGLIPVGAIINERPDLATTSSQPRYALRRSFAALFDDALKGEELEAAIKKWQQDNLSSQAFARLMLASRTAKGKENEAVFVDFPDGERKRMAPGESSHISKAVIEVFAKVFLENPAVILLSESKTKVIRQDEEVAERVGLKIDKSKVLPDIILADLGPENGSADPLLVFVECVATDGAITAKRKDDLQQYANETGFEKNVAFVTAFWDRAESKGYQKVYRKLAWGTFVWFVTEPENLMVMYEGLRLTGKRLSDILRSATDNE